MMKSNTRKLFLTLTAFLLTGSLLSAQPPGASIEKIDGVKYYIHTVESGHTLWGLSKNYAVSIDAIKSANPGLTDGLQLGQIIKIPVGEVNKKAAKTAPVLEGNQLLHTIAKGETLYGLAKKYNVSQANLEALNPEASKGLSIGQQIRIPTDKVETTDVAAIAPAKPNLDSLKVHPVKPGETLYSIAKQYNTEVDSIAALNPNVLTDGLKIGSMLRVPEANPLFVPTITNIAGNTSGDEPALEGAYNVSVMLPFYLADNQARTMKKSAILPKSVNAADLYNGILLAVDSMKQAGLNVNLYVYDTSRDSATIARVLNKPEMKEMHLIIGPLYNSSIQQVSKFAKANNIHMVLPVSKSSKRLLGQPGISKVTASSTTQVQHLARYVADKRRGENVILVQPRNLRELKLFDKFKATYSALTDSAPGTYNDSLVIGVTEKLTMKSLSAKFKRDKVNVLVMPSNDKAFAHSFFTMLAALKPRTYGDYKFEIYGLDAWAGFDDIPMTEKQRYNVHFTSPNYCNFETEAAIQFVQHFRALHGGADAAEFSLLGFDIAYYYLTGLLQYGTAFPSHFSEIQTEPLYQGFNFRKTGMEHGFENDAVRILKYQDYNLMQVR